MDEMKTHIPFAVNNLVAACHQASLDAGWYKFEKTYLGKGEYAEKKIVPVPEKLCLIHSEISEAMEGDRKDLMDDHLPHRKMMEVELADALIRICDLAGAMDFDLGGAVVEKMAYNKLRSDHKAEARSGEGGKRY